MLMQLLTIHPAIVAPVFRESILGRANEAGIIDLRVVNIRDHALSKHQQTDDYPYGGGAGLLMKPEPVYAAVRWAAGRGPEGARPPRIILMDPQGRRFNQRMAEELALEDHLILVCGRYEGFDERIRSLATDEISIGDYVLMGGELAALVVVEAVARLIPGVLGDLEASVAESHTSGLLEGPQYTRPLEFEGMRVPEILTSGNHGAIDRWRREQALRRTFERRPDLLETADLSAAERAMVEEWRRTQER